MHQQPLFLGRILEAKFGGVLGPAIHVAIDRVVDDFDFFPHVENPQGAVAQVVGDGGDAVALVDGIAGDGQVGAVQPDQRDVRAVERGDEGQAAASRTVRQHLARQQSAHGVRNRVVHVLQVKIVQLGNLSHARGQRQIVRRIIEQRIPRHFDFVIVNVGFLAAQPDGLGIGDEMNLVAALGQFETEFGGHHAAAAVGGITGDPDLHSAVVRPFQ